MDELRKGLDYRVVGIREGGGRGVRYENLSLATAEQIKGIMLHSHFYRKVVIEDQRGEKQREGP